jgi:hypothetical protein
MMILVDLARAGVITVLPVLYLAGELRVEYVYTVAFVQATLGILFDAGEFAAIPALVGTDELVAANGRVLAVNQLGQVIGPLLAGLVVAVLAPAELLFVDAATFGASALALVAVRRSLNPAGGSDEPSAASVVRRLLRDVGEGLRFVLHHPVLRSISIMMALINFVAGSADAQLVLFAKERLHATDQQVGWLFAAGSAGVVLVGLSAGWWRRRLPFPVVALGTLMLSGLMLAAFGLTPWYWPALVLWAAQSGFGLLLNINTGALRQAITPNDMLGRVMSIAGVLAWSAIPLGGLAGAAVIESTGRIALLYCVMGLLMTLIAAAFWLSPIRHGQRYLDQARAGPGTATVPE